MRKLSIIVLLVAALSSCKKSSSSGSSNPAYCPTSAGSTWMYLRNSSDSVYKDSVYTFTATDSTTIIDNKKFNVFNSSTDTDVYYAVTDTGYYRTGSLLSGLGIPALATFDELYFKGTAPSDTAWTNYITFPYKVTGLGTINVTVNLNYSLMATNTTQTILNNTFTDVAVVHLAFSSNLPLYGLTSLGSGDFYYSKSVGLISFNITTTIPMQPTVTTTFNLKSYKIK